ncbi:hypothetical protein SKAU_G00144930 [Synaphobranchus kaupii]|uniref:Transcription factor A, mitochondrial n=1 Tax=Synaphobranchus kaupii TaxID=118154 RepID=A0A9Q1FT35_SYNKA|nr:hypothetical protein SKAU_G00144930 [Synaphobranchus kaupii]
MHKFCADSAEEPHACSGHAGLLIGSEKIQACDLARANLLVKPVVLFSSSSFARWTVAVCKTFSTTSAQRPKRPLTSYMRFVKQQHPLVVRQNPDLKIVEIVKRIAQHWRALSPEQKRPFQEASLADHAQYKMEVEKFKSQLTPAQSAALNEERRQKLAKRKSIRHKRELALLGKPKRPRSAFNIFMAEHFSQARGTTMQEKLISMLDDWKKLYLSQKQVYIQLAEDDRIRYKNEMKSWEEHMIEIGREDVVRGKKPVSKKTVSTKGGKKKSKVKAVKRKVAAKSSTSTSSGSTKARKTTKTTKTLKKAEE